MEETFARTIQEHLDLKSRNSHLETPLPLSAYLGEQGVFNAETSAEGAAFDTAEWQGKRHSGERSQVQRPRAESFLESLEDVWSSGSAFDWGDDRPA